MDQNLINWALALCGGLLGWLMKVIWDAINDMKSDLRQIERDLPELYVRKDDWRESLRGLKDDMKDGFHKIDLTLNSIFKKIDIVSRHDQQP